MLLLLKYSLVLPSVWYFNTPYRRKKEVCVGRKPAAAIAQPQAELAQPARGG